MSLGPKADARPSWAMPGHATPWESMAPGHPSTPTARYGPIEAPSWAMQGSGLKGLQMMPMTPPYVNGLLQGGRRASQAHILRRFACKRASVDAGRKDTIKDRRIALQRRREQQNRHDARQQREHAGICGRAAA